MMAEADVILTVHTRQSADAGEKVMTKFFEEIYNAMKMYINFDVVKAVLIGRYPMHYTGLCFLLL